MGPSTSITTSEKQAALPVDEDDLETSQAQSYQSQMLPRAKPSSAIQFLDLPGKSPLISFQGQVFTGTWGETLGSDLIFASTTDLPQGVTPLIKGKDGKWCLLGVSQTTLVAKPVELIKRSRLEIQSTGDTGSLPASAHTDTPAARSKPRKPFTIVLEPDTDAKLKRQAAYLEQLMAVKIARGEKDVVYLGKAMHYLDANGEKQRAPGFSKRDLDKMNEGVLLRGADAKRRRAEANAELQHKTGGSDQNGLDGNEDDTGIDLEADGADEDGIDGEVNDEDEEEQDQSDEEDLENDPT